MKLILSMPMLAALLARPASLSTPPSPGLTVSVSSEEVAKS